jgi:hypothetical protein
LRTARCCIEHRLDGKSRMNREIHVRFRERSRVRFPRATRRNIYVGSQVAGEHAMTELTKFLKERLKLNVNRDKSARRGRGAQVLRLQCYAA